MLKNQNKTVAPKHMHWKTATPNSVCISTMEMLMKNKRVAERHTYIAHCSSLTDKALLCTIMKYMEESSRLNIEWIFLDKHRHNHNKDVHVYKTVGILLLLPLHVCMWFNLEFLFKRTTLIPFCIFLFLTEVLYIFF